MSKERLEEIKERYMEHEYDYALSAMDIDWLIEQAERVQEYEYTQKYEDKLIKQNKRYREATKKAIEDLENECLWDALVKLKALEGEE